MQKETASFNWDKKTYRTSVVFLPICEIIFFGDTWLFNLTICSCWNKNEHLFNYFPPPKKFVEISFFLGGENPSSLDSFSFTWVKQNKEGWKGVKRLYGRYFFHSQINLVSKHWLCFSCFLLHKSSCVTHIVTHNKTLFQASCREIYFCCKSNTVSRASKKKTER